MNWAFFIFFGSSIYWESFNFGFLKLWKLFVVTILIFIFRRLPAVLVFRNWITPIRFFKESIYVGWFGPIGVGAMWYIALALQKLQIEPYEHSTGPNGEIIKTDNELFLMYYSTITFIVLCSIILNGVTVPMAHMTLTYTTRSFAKKDNANAAWPKNMPIDSNIISGPISALNNNMIKKPEDGEGDDIANQKMEPIKEDVYIEMNESTAIGEDNYSENNDEEKDLIKESEKIDEKFPSKSHSTLMKVNEDPISDDNNSYNTQVMMASESKDLTDSQVGGDPSSNPTNPINTATPIPTGILIDTGSAPENQLAKRDSIHSMTVENGHNE